MIIILIPVLVLIAGLFLYFAAKNPRFQEVGKWMFIVGLLVTLWRVGGESLKL